MINLCFYVFKIGQSTTEDVTGAVEALVPEVGGNSPIDKSSNMFDMSSQER